MTSRPRVSVVTPVFNGEPYLAQCIESVLAQTYENWDYTIVNNCSTDRSLEIAQSYAARDSRIRVRNNVRFADLIENHNLAFQAISPDSKYCKLISADDWLYPESLVRLVEHGETHPTAGVIGSYSISAFGIKWCGLSCDRGLFGGREIVRQFFTGAVDTFWVPSTVLYRASLVRQSPVFFPGASPAGDLSACLRCLTTTDLGFVHQILSFERVHSSSDTDRVRAEGTYLLDRVEVLNAFGPAFLAEAEIRDVRETMLHNYFRDVLAPAFFDRRPPEFWATHKRRLKELGYSLYGRRLMKAVGLKLMDLMLNPKTSIEKTLRRVRRGM